MLDSFRRGLVSWALNLRSAPSRSTSPKPTRARAASAGEHMDFTLTPEQESFRAEVRAWLGRNVQQDWVARLQRGSDIPRPEAYGLLRQWQREMYEGGFGRPPGPKEGARAGR